MLSKSSRMLSSFFRRRRSKPSLDSWAVDEDWERGGSRGVSASSASRRSGPGLDPVARPGLTARGGGSAASAPADAGGPRASATTAARPGRAPRRPRGGGGGQGTSDRRERGRRPFDPGAAERRRKRRERREARRAAVARRRADDDRENVARRAARRSPRPRRASPPRGAARPTAAARGGRVARGGAAATRSARDLRSEPADDAPAAAGAKGGKLCCSKCDGAHESSKCPHFKKQRDSHPDATRNLGKGKTLGSDCPPVVVRRARVIPQPPDGSCLFHSLSYGLRDGRGATSLRREIMAFIRNNPDLKISDTPLRDWIHWDALVSVATYTQRMSRGGWGGGIEMAATSELKNCNVEVYAQCALGYKRISLFQKQGAEKTVRVCYRGGVHYDSLVI
ncbi:hypothetical protein JL720_2733 [Aureococcus anophagefferens]|nr:hypothetical protein JL720_2733 [Aureococcus anophagefferens]